MMGSANAGDFGLSRIFGLGLVVGLTLGVNTATLPAYASTITRKRVRTYDGLTFELPAQLREVPVQGIPVLGEPGANDQMEGSYSDGTLTALQVVVSRNERGRASSLPLPSEGLVQDYTSGFREGMRIRAKLSEAYDISPASYDAELGAYTVRFKTRAASLANQLLGQPDTSTIWAQVRQAGVAPGELRCVFKGLLAGRNAADAAQLRANIGDTTQRCGWSASRLEQYISETPTLFSPVVSAMTSIAFFTKAASIQIIVAAPVSRVADVQATAELIRSTAQLPANIQLKTSLLHDLEDWSPVVVGRLIGALFGPVFVVVIVGGAFSLLLVKLGTRGSIAFPAVCAVLLLLVALGSLRAPTLSVFTLIQYGSYLSTMLLTLRPITRWISTRAAKAAP